mmetsp:Transcript_145003/g.255601  ORF Transcript_145003/g.255601 Transcript_145003/m.255601 type:complete len:148 (+) Transcript_145003:80-523(+)
MDSATYLLIVVASVVLGARLLLRSYTAWNKQQSIQAVLKRHHREQPAEAATTQCAQRASTAPSLVRTVLGATDRKLRIGLGIAAFLALSGFLPNGIQHMLLLDGRIGNALAVAARWTILAGIVRTIPRLPLQQWLGAGGKRPQAKSS